MAGSSTKAGRRLSRLNSNFVYSPNVPHFLSAARDTKSCIRCEVAIKSKSLYATVAQVSEDRLSGGMLCAKCVSSFRQWITKGEKDDDGITTKEKDEDKAPG